MRKKRDKQAQGAQAFQTGMDAEARAQAYLKEQGYEVLKCRYRNGYGEIDVIAQKQGRLHFVEVKARKTLADSLYALSAKQQQRLMQCALGFVAEHPIYQQNEMQFDLIAIAGWQLHHEMHILLQE